MKSFDRRSFIKNTALTGFSFSALHKQPYSIPVQKATTPKKIIIGGAGIAGLCCGFELMKKGHEVVIMEASGRHGGHVFTAHDGLSDGLYGDLGAEHFPPPPAYEKLWAYTRELNLEVLAYPRRKNLLRRINNQFYSEQMLADPKVLKELGFNSNEVAYLDKHPFWQLSLLYAKPYLDKFTDEYQPFNIGYDELDKISMNEFLQTHGASTTALGYIGSNDSSALFELWRLAILNLRGVPEFPVDVYRLKGGNQMLPNAFAKKLGERVWLNCPVVSISQDRASVTVKYKRYNEELEMQADYFINCIPLPAFKKIPVIPEWSAEKQYLIDNVVYDSYQRFVFQANSKFWLKDNLSINMELNHPDLWEVWQCADEVDTHRVIILGTGPGGVSPQRALAAFRECYPGKKDSIELAISKDWTKEVYSSTCERMNFPIGELHKFWPGIIKPAGRIYFAGAYADNLNWGMEAATRSANRVANEINATT